MPTAAIRQVLTMGGLSIIDIDMVAFHGLTWGDGIEERLKRYFSYTFGACPPIHLVHHHHAHAAAAYYSSPFDEALIVTADGSGDGISTRISYGKGPTIEPLEEYARPHSLGLFYSAITQFCGFQRDREEYKLMGLAAYGNPDRYDLSAFLHAAEGRYVVDTRFFIDMPPRTPSPNWQEMLFNEALEHLLRLKKRTTQAITQEYIDVAAAAQYQLEITMEHLVRHHVLRSGVRYVCLSGGVALNCKMNQRIMNMPEVHGLYVPPVAADMGIALGAAYIAYLHLTNNKPSFSTVYCGNYYDDKEIEKILRVCGVPYVRPADVISVAAQLLANNKVIGWFQGGMEYGPRALGNRSILANALCPDIKNVVNQKIKLRESFRPFGASVLEEDMSTYFDGKNHSSPYMTVVYDVKKQYQTLLKAVTHADGTCRIQTVTAQQNPLFYELLLRFKELTGHGILLNTSLNLNHEPIVCSPRDALATYFASGLDALLIGNFLVKKNF